MHTLAKRRRRKYISLFIPLVITTIFWLFAKDFRNEEFVFSNILRFTSQLLALWGLVMLSINYFITTRFHFVEQLFGGLDKVYHFHKSLSKWAFIFILLHPILLIINAIPDTELALTLFINPDTIAKAFGITSLYLFALLLLITITKSIPYHIWKITHSLIGVPFFFGATHGLMAESDIKYYEPLRLWIIFWIIVGVASYIYKLFLYTKIGPKFPYKVQEVKKLNNKVSEIYLEPLKRRINFEPGEFVFLSFKKHEWIPSEHHPFSISSAPEKNYLRISYKEMGDYTHLLKHAKEDDLVDVYGPYGEFTSYVFNSYKKQIWIAAGIGVTPFLSMLHYEVHNDDKKDIHFFYCNRKPKDTLYEDEILETMKNADDNINYHCVLSSKHGRITANKIIDKVDDIENYLIILCGPIKMMKSLKLQFENKGVSSDMIVFEDFSFK